MIEPPLARGRGRSHLGLHNQHRTRARAQSQGVACFDVLAACRARVAEAISVPMNTLELSMGMSADYEAAIAHGSTNVRVGSTIFGARDH